MVYLRQLFQENQFKPIYYHGNTVHLTYDIPMTGPKFVSVSVDEVNSSYQQGVRLMMKTNVATGYVKLDDSHEEFEGVTVRTEECPVQYECVPDEACGTLRVVNVWWSKNTGGLLYCTGNSGMLVEVVNRNQYRFRCSHGPGEVNFHDLVFCLTLDDK